MSLYTEAKRCRSCDSDRLDVVLDLGVQAISDFPEKIFHADSVVEEYDRAPLTLLRCHDCTLVQLAHTVDRDRLYRRYYYKSGTNESMVAALKDVAHDALNRVKMDIGDAVLDIGANDGTLLEQFGPSPFKVGLDPAFHRPEVAQEWCHGYFPTGDQDHLPSADFKIITSIAQFYNVDDPNAYVAEIKRILHPEGIWVVQMMDVASMLRQNAFDNVCHEHLTYWSTRAFKKLVRRHGLYVRGLSYNDTNGGSARIIVGHQRDESGVNTLLYDPDIESWQAFRHNVLALKNSTLRLLENLACRVAGYAASTKASTLLQFYGIGPELLPYIADRNPEKWGKTTVTGIPIISEEDMRWREPDYLVALAWHFLPAFMKREADFLERGGQWLVPLPELRVIGGECDPYLRQETATSGPRHQAA